MVVKTEMSFCTGCGVCSAICPVHCITMKRDRYGFLYPSIDENICIKCNKCDRFCHAQDISELKNPEPLSFIGYNRNEEQRSASASGGVFVLLAQEILNLNGIVYGAAFDESWEVSHIRVDSREELYRLQGSKYVQSTVDGKIYSSVLNDLKNNKYVLYSGTPCQIGALRKFLEGDYDRLLTVSFICHGVPSPALWKQYVDEQKAYHSSEISGISHRNKKYGWTGFSMMFRFSDGFEYCTPQKKDPYLQLFLKNTCLRDSCHHCQYKGKDHLSGIDIVLGDKWGNIPGSLPNMYDDKGISIILVQTHRGEIFWEKIKDGLYYDETVYKEVAASNISLDVSAVPSVKRNKVLTEIGNVSVKQMYIRYARTPLRKRIKESTIRFIRKIAKACGIVWLVQKVRNGK